MPGAGCSQTVLPRLPVRCMGGGVGSRAPPRSVLLLCGVRSSIGLTRDAQAEGRWGLWFQRITAVGLKRNRACINYT